MEKKLKIFISMGMKSKSTEQVRQEMNKVFVEIQKDLPNVVLIDSVIDNADKEIAIKGNSISIWYLGKSLELMSEANLVFFINDWENYKGCKIERMVAEKYGKLCVNKVIK